MQKILISRDLLKDYGELSEKIYMEIKRCLICMYQGLIRVGTNSDVIYRGNEEKHLMLCYAHSVELFKDGQIKFVEKYHNNFAEFELDNAIYSSPSSSRSRTTWY